MNLNKIMSLRGFKQMNLAKQVGVDEPMMSKFCNYKCLPTPTTMQKLLKELNCEISDIYSEREVRFPRKKQIKKPTCYKLTIRLPREEKKALHEALSVCGYKNVTFWINQCLEALKNEAKEKTSSHCTKVTDEAIRRGH